MFHWWWRGAMGWIVLCVSCMQDLWKHIMERTFTFFQQKKGGGGVYMYVGFSSWKKYLANVNRQI